MKRIIFILCIAIIFVTSCNNETKTGKNLTPGPDSSSKEKTPTIADSSSTGIVFPSPGEFHRMLARSNGIWEGKGTMQFSSESTPVNAGTSLLTNTMAMDGLYQVSEIKGNTTPGMGAPWTGLRITGYDNQRKVFTRAMIGDGTAAGGVAMEGPWNEAARSIIMPFKKINSSTGKEQNLKEVYKIIDENTEVLEIYATDPKTKMEFKMLNITWTRINKK